jgi:hypothetical protein
MSLRRRLVRIVGLASVAAVALALPAGAVRAARPAGEGGRGVPATLSPSLAATSRLDDRRYVASGDRAYDIGTEAGRYPAMGWHIRGEMGGIWAPPLKLLDGIWFGLDGQWLGNASRFRSGYGYVQFDVPGPNGVKVTRTDVAPDGMRAVLIGLTLDNPGQERAATLTMDAHSELMSAYPWGWTTPSQATFNLQDTASIDKGNLVFRDNGTPPGGAAHDWAATVGSSLGPVGGATGAGFRGPQEPPFVCPLQGSANDPRCDDGPYGKGAGGELRYRVELPAGQSRTVWFTVAGSDQGVAGAQKELKRASDDPAGQLIRKVQSRLNLAGHTLVDLPGDPGLATAIQWGKQNLADLTQEAHDVQVRPTNQGAIYPAPVGTLSTMRFEGAGFPDYPWMFATDGEYTSFALVAAGQTQTVKDHLRSLRAVSELANQGSGKVVHETVTDGSIYFGLNSDPGDMDETAKFPSAVALVWRWTGDTAWRDEMYSFVQRNLHFLLEKSDVDRDLWPEGSGNVEGAGLGPEKLDVAVYTLRGLLDLADMAASKGDQATRQWALTNATSMEQRFESTWWMPQVPQYADSLNDPGNQPTQQRWWIGDTPMEAELSNGATPAPGLADPAHAVAALDLRHTPCYTGQSGLYVQGANGCDGASTVTSGNQTSFSLNTAIQAVAEGNYGRMGADQQQRYTSFNRDLQLRPDEMPGALPEIGPSPNFVDNIDQPFTTRSSFMQSWGFYGTIWTVVHQQLGVVPDLGDGRLEITPQVPDGQQRISGSDILIGGGRLSVTATHRGSTYGTWLRSTVSTATFIGSTLPAGSRVATVTLDGHPVTYTIRDDNRGRHVLVQTSTGTHQLTVTTA